MEPRVQSGLLDEQLKAIRDYRRTPARGTEIGGHFVTSFGVLASDRYYPSVGTVTVTVVPPPGRERTASEPPTSSARSAIDNIP